MLPLVTLQLVAYEVIVVAGVRLTKKLIRRGRSPRLQANRSMVKRQHTKFFVCVNEDLRISAMPAVN